MSLAKKAKLDSSSSASTCKDARSFRAEWTDNFGVIPDDAVKRYVLCVANQL